MRAQSSAVLTADWIHGKSNYLILTHCLAKIESVVFVDKEGARFGWRRER
jgi:hypothetical protein